MADWQSGDVVANGIRIHYYRTGGDKPPLVLNHGATDNGLCWTRVAHALEADYDVILPDARGHGLSEAPARGYSSRDRAADVAGLIQALNLDHPVVGGHSMGALTTMHCAASYPSLLGRAILEDPPIWSSNAPPQDPNRPNPFRDWLRELKALSRGEIMARGRAQSPDWDESEFEPWTESKLQVSPSFLDQPFFQGEQPWQTLAAQITCPTILITADPEKGAIVTPEAAEEARRRNPLIEVVRLNGAGHNIRRERFDDYVAAVRAFLAES